jgi:hypothetical protein
MTPLSWSKANVSREEHLPHSQKCEMVREILAEAEAQPSLETLGLTSNWNKRPSRSIRRGTEQAGLAQWEVTMYTDKKNGKRISYISQRDRVVESGEACTQDRAG